MERDVLNRILKTLGTGTRRLFRNNIGTGWAGRVVKGPRAVELGPNDVAVFDARPLHAGLMKDSGDIIGWQTVTVTQDMVGDRIAVFVSIEVKDRGSATQGQLRWAGAVQAAGGRAGVARNVEQAEFICDGGSRSGRSGY